MAKRRAFIPLVRVKLLDRVATTWAGAQPHYRDVVLLRIGTIFDRFMETGLADPHFCTELLDAREHVYKQRLAELLLADYLWSAGFKLASSSAGPDFLATKDGQSAWIELITPMPIGIDPKTLATPSPGTTIYDPQHEAIALRYTAAIKEKQEKLVGRSGKPGYLEKGIVQSDIPYIIAVNQCLLQHKFPSLMGISQIPVACEVLFGVGPTQWLLDRNTGKKVDENNVHRPIIVNANQALVPSENFLSPAYAAVSAVFAVHLNEDVYAAPLDPSFFPREHPTALVYNPLAHSPLPIRWMRAGSHWKIEVGDEQNIVNQIMPGSTHQRE